MDEIKIALEMQRRLLGPGMHIGPCGCVVHVGGNFPKKPWIFISQYQIPCSTGPSSGPHIDLGWHDKTTGTRVKPADYQEAWDAAKKNGLSENGDVGLIVGRYALANRDGSLMHRISEVAKDLVVSPRGWPGKLSEVMPWRR